MIDDSHAPLRAGRARKLGLVAALLACPATAWLVAFLANDATRGRHGAYIVVGALAFLPAALGALVNAMLGRDRRSVVVAAFLAAFVSLAGFGGFLVYFFLTAPVFQPPPSGA